MSTTRTAPKPQPRTGFPSDRVGIAAGYRHLADLIESGQAPIPVNCSVTLNMNYGDWKHTEEEEPALARDLMRALGGGTYRKDQYGSDLILRGMCGGLPVDLWVSRDAVCKRVVTGTTTVTETVPVGEDTRPVETVTRQVETFEWHCGSVLDAAAETADTIEVQP